MARSLMLLAGSVSLVAIGCTQAADVQGAETALIAGEVERDADAVVYLVNADADTNCTGTIISPRVVLTARHCVANAREDGLAAPEDIWLEVGATTGEQQLFVQEVRAPEGRWDWQEEATPETIDEAYITTDIALLSLTERASVEPMPVTFGDPSDLIAQSVSVFGFGQTPEGFSGMRRVRSAWVLGVWEQRRLWTESISCDGDSGGPVVDETGAVVGVVSGSYHDCVHDSGSWSFQTSTADFRELIEGAIEDTVCPHGECNAFAEPWTEAVAAPYEEPVADPEQVEEGTAGCSAGGRPAPLWCSFALGLLALRRRRQSSVLR